MSSDNAKAPKVVRRKVKPYPIAGVLDKGGQKFELEIILLTPKGLIGKLKSGMCFVGVHYQCQFELPVSRIGVNTEVKVWKTYDKSLDPKQGLVERMVEVLFVKLNKTDKQNISSFLSAIGQN